MKTGYLSDYLYNLRNEGKKVKKETIKISDFLIKEKIYIGCETLKDIEYIMKNIYDILSRCKNIQYNIYFEGSKGMIIVDIVWRKPFCMRI